MYHKMHDGPKDDYTIVSGAIRRGNVSHASLSALQWAADRANQSYGIFVQGLKPEDEQRIQEAYDAYKAGRSSHIED